MNPRRKEGVSVNRFSKPAGIAATLAVLLAAAASSVHAQDREAELKRLGEELVRWHESALQTLKSVQDEASAQAAVSEIARTVQQGVDLERNWISAGKVFPAREANRITKPTIAELVKLMRQERQEYKRIRGLKLAALDDSALAEAESKLNEVLKRLSGGGLGSLSVPKGALGMLFPALLFLVFLFCVAFLYREGMWGNAIVLVNVIIAGLLAVNFWEPVSRMLEGFLPSLTFMHDMLALWGVFSISLMAFSTATRKLSKFKVRFKQIIDQIGSVAFAVLVGWVMVCFTTMSLHMAPLGKNFLFGGFQPEKRMFFGLAPDRQWLWLVKMTSKGSMKRWTTREFDPGNQFIRVYNDRRQALEDYVNEHNSVRVSREDFGKEIEKR